MGITQKTIAALQGLPFDNLIGGPLNACVRAQADAAQTTLDFIQSIGLEEDENGHKQAVYVYFSFIQGGRKAVMSIPLLTIVPIPYIAINTIDINFKATITGVESSSFTQEMSKQVDTTSKGVRLNIWRAKATNLKTSVSSKKDSKSTRDSSFSIESTLDVAVHASQDSMPAGMAKVLEMLGSAMDLLDPNGELSFDATEYYVTDKDAKADIVAQYKTPQGVFETGGFKIDGQAPTKEQLTENKSEGTVTLHLPPKTKTADRKTEPVAYSISVGSVSQDIFVKIAEQTATTTATANNG